MQIQKQITVVEMRVYFCPPPSMSFLNPISSSLSPCVALSVKINSLVDDDYADRGVLVSEMSKKKKTTSSFSPFSFNLSLNMSHASF